MYYLEYEKHQKIPIIWQEKKKQALEGTAENCWKYLLLGPMIRARENIKDVLFLFLSLKKITLFQTMYV